MTNHDILKTAMEQSAIDSNCNANDFLSSENKLVLSGKHPAARKYLELPFLCDFTSYGNNIVASVSPQLQEIAASFLSRFAIEHCFETPNLHVFVEALKPLGYNVCFMAEYFLPDLSAMTPLTCAYETKLLTADDFEALYVPEWSNALCEARKHLDRLAVGAFDGDQLIGLAGCSADCDTMWQIGVDVLPQYRRQGIAACLTNRLAYEILETSRVPFYCCAWSNMKSARNAVKSGFRPAWVQMTVKTSEFIEGLNK